MLKKYTLSQALVWFFFITFSQNIFSQVAENKNNVCPLLIGSKIPEMTVKNQKNQDVTTKDIFDSPTVLIIYRGGWCPFCNAHLKDLQGIEKQVKSLGYKIVAISPDSGLKEQKTFEKHDLSYKLYSDSSTAFIQAMGLAFKAPKIYKTILKRGSGGMNESVIPVPSVFVVDKSREVVFSYANPNFKHRLKAETLLSVLKDLK